MTLFIIERRSPMMKIFRSIAGTLVLLTLCSLMSCTSSSKESNQSKARSSEPTPVAVAPAFTPPLKQSNPTLSAKSEPAAPPNPDEVQNAVSRIFDKVASAELSRKPAFMVGDFNGDGSEDLVVWIKPNEGQLGEINNELANWVLEDPKNVTPRKTKPPAAPTRVHAEKDEILLAVIHGADNQGWRNPEAKQTYLLKNDGATKITWQSLKDLQGTSDRQKLPLLRGDAINETINGKTGIIYWTGAKYAWHGTGSK